MTSGVSSLHRIERFLAVVDDLDDEAGALQREPSDELDIEIVFSEDDVHEDVGAITDRGLRRCRLCGMRRSV